MTKTATQPKTVSNLVNEETLLKLIFPNMAPEDRPTRRTMLHWREEGLLPYVKMGRGKSSKSKVYYPLDECAEAIQALTHQGRRRHASRSA
jgi:hypothetical protein